MKSIIAIGGLGGSGTRVVAEIVKESGYFIGNDLNKESDNLLFTRLLKNKAWRKNATKKEIVKRLSWFNSIMSGEGQNISSNEKKNLIKSINDNETFASSIEDIDMKAYSRTVSYAWKEPNTHIYLKYLNKAIPGVKYLHVIRDGLDMAHTSNTQQLENWGSLLYDIEFNIDNPESIIRSQLSYWIKANTKAIKDGRLYLKDHFMLCNFDRLCSHPDDEIPRILNFIGIAGHNALLSRLTNLPIKPASSGRHKKSAIQFSQEEKMKVYFLNSGRIQ